MKANHDKGAAAKPLRHVSEGEEVIDRVTKQGGKVFTASNEMSRQMVVPQRSHCQRTYTMAHAIPDFRPL